MRCRRASSVLRRVTRTRAATAGSDATSEINQPVINARRCGSARKRIATRRAVSGTSTAACVSWARAASRIASLRRSRRQHPMANINIAAAQRNGSWPRSSASTSAGFTRTATAHQPRRTSGKAQKVATTSSDESGAEHEGHAPLGHERPQQDRDHPRDERVGKRERVAVGEHRHVEREAVAVPQLVGHEPHVHVVRQRVARDHLTMAEEQHEDGRPHADDDPLGQPAAALDRFGVSIGARSATGSELPSSADAVAVAKIAFHRPRVRSVALGHGDRGVGRGAVRIGLDGSTARVLVTIGSAAGRGDRRAGRRGTRAAGAPGSTRRRCGRGRMRVCSPCPCKASSPW